MKNFYILAILIAAPVLLAACTDNQPVPVPVPEDGKVKFIINTGVEDSPETRLYWEEDKDPKVVDWDKKIKQAKFHWEDNEGFSMFAAKNKSTNLAENNVRFTLEREDAEQSTKFYLSGELSQTYGPDHYYMCVYPYGAGVTGTPGIRTENSSWGAWDVMVPYEDFSYITIDYDPSTWIVEPGKFSGVPLVGSGKLNADGNAVEITMTPVCAVLSFFIQNVEAPAGSGIDSDEAIDHVITKVRFYGNNDETLGGGRLRVPVHYSGYFDLGVNNVFFDRIGFQLESGSQKVIEYNMNLRILANQGNNVSFPIPSLKYTKGFTVELITDTNRKYVLKHTPPTTGPSVDQMFNTKPGTLYRPYPIRLTTMTYTAAN